MPLVLVSYVDSCLSSTPYLIFIKSFSSFFIGITCPRCSSRHNLPPSPFPVSIPYSHLYLNIYFSSIFQLPPKSLSLTYPICILIFHIPHSTFKTSLFVPRLPVYFLPPIFFLNNPHYLILHDILLTNYLTPITFSGDFHIFLRTPYNNLFIISRRWY